MSPALGFRRVWLCVLMPVLYELAGHRILLDGGKGFYRTDQATGTRPLGVLSLLKAISMKRTVSYEGAFLANIGGVHYG